MESEVLTTTKPADGGLLALLERVEFVLAAIAPRDAAADGSLAGTSPTSEGSPGALKTVSPTKLPRGVQVLA
jgi:hypothetical protein